MLNLHTFVCLLMNLIHTVALYNPPANWIDHTDHLLHSARNNPKNNQPLLMAALYYSEHMEYRFAYFLLLLKAPVIPYAIAPVNKSFSLLCPALLEPLGQLH